MREQIDGAVRYAEKIVEAFDRVAVEAVERYQEGAPAQKNTAEGDVKYQAQTPKYDYSKPFNEQIDDFKLGKIPQRDTLVIGATPKVYLSIGLNALPMTINTTHVDYALNGTKDIDHHLGEVLLKQLPDKLKEPIAVFVSKTKGNTSVVALLNFTVNGKQVVAPIVIDGFGVQNALVIDSNSITSVYGKNAGIAQLYQAAQDEANGKFALLYANKKEAISLLHRAGHQLSGSLIPRDGFYHSIREKNSPVKPKFIDVTETQQFKRWFGDWKKHPGNASKVVNVDGTPKVVYHGTNAEQFHTFSYGHIGLETGVSILGDGFYFTDKKKLAKNYGPNIYECYLQMKKPYHATDTDAYKLSTNQLKAQGYDGVILEAPAGTVYMVFDNTQIKSATDNIGTFDGSNPDIRYQHRTTTLSNRMILERASKAVDAQKLTPGQRSTLKVFQDHLDKLRELETKKEEQQKIIDDARKRGTRQVEYQAAINRRNILTTQINRESTKLLEVENTPVLRRVLEQAKNVIVDEQTAIRKQALTDYRKKRTESRERTEARHKILRVAKELNHLLLREDKKHHVPDSMKKAVASALDLLELDTVNAAERIAKYDALIAQATDQDVIDSLTVTRENIKSQGEKIGARLKELHAAYAEIMKSEDPDISAGYDPVIDGNLKELAESIGDTPFSELSVEQLEDVYSMYKMVLTRVRDANKSLTDSRNATISQRSLAVIRQIRAVGGSHKYLQGSGKANAFAWNNLKPIYAIEKLGSPALKEAFWSLIEAEGGYARDIKEASDFADKMRKEYGYDKWDMKKKYSFKSTSGIEFELTLEQVMSLYAFSRREQALDHLRIGGFVFDSNIETYKVTETVDQKTGEAKQKRSILKYRVNTADAHQLSQDILTDIISVLDAKQAKFVEEMQGYLSDTMGAKGNEVSMAMYGIKLFKEKHYWPLKSSNSYMFQQNEMAGEVRIKNAGFAQKTKPKANNPIILQNFMDVWAGHVHDMSMYHSFTLPIEDFNRIFNFATHRKEGEDPQGVKTAIQNACGKEAVDYLRQMIVDLNGGARSDTREGVSKQLMGRFKKAAVAGSLSVAIQQPSALNRAKALIPDKYFLTLNPRLLSTGKLWEECKTYAPVAMIKEMGKFDMDTGMGTINYIKSDKKGIMDVVDDVTGWLPAKADEWTWVQIWAAVKKETAARHPELAVSSKQFLEAAGKRFTEVIVKTQVYDSTLSRSAFMRSKSGLLQMATSFMAEPTTSINMIEDAIRQYKRGYRQQATKTARAVLDSMVANAVLVSLIYALRDDDEDETFVEKYFSALTSEIVDGLNPLTYIPWVKDAWSIAQGFDVERSDMSLISDIADALTTFGKLCAKDTDAMSEKELSEHRRKIAVASWGLVEQVANFFGLPVRNVRRDVMAFINTGINTVQNVKNGIVDNPRSFWSEIKEAVQDVTPVLGWFNDSKSDKLYDALTARDTAQINRLKITYRDDEGKFNVSAYRSAVRKGLRENDPRIRTAAKARLNGDHTKANKLLNQIAAEGHFDRSDISAAIKAEYNRLKDD